MVVTRRKNATKLSESHLFSTPEYHLIHFQQGGNWLYSCIRENVKMPSIMQSNSNVITAPQKASKAGECHYIFLSEPCNKFKERMALSEAVHHSIPQSADGT